jgi:hypothetical protein
MAASTCSFVAHRTVVVPVLAVVALALTWGRELRGVVVVVAAAFATVATIATLSLVLPTFHNQQTRPRVLPGPTRLRRRGFPRAVRAVRDGADGAPPRLLPADHHQRRSHRRRGARCPSPDADGPGQSRTADPGAHRRGGVPTVVPGRATLLQGGVHLVLLAAFPFLAANP